MGESALAWGGWGGRQPLPLRSCRPRFPGEAKGEVILLLLPFGTLPDSVSSWISTRKELDFGTDELLRGDRPSTARTVSTSS